MKKGLGLIVAIVMIATGMLVYFTNTEQESIGSALARCMRGSDPVSQECLRPTLQKLLASTSSAALMHYIVAPNSPESVRGQCHAIAHEIGQETFLREKSLERTLEACTQECNSGCVHGAIAANVAATLGETYLGEEIEHADTTQLDALGKKYCEGSRALCHGIGHIARIATSSLSGALQTCDRVASTNARRSCYLGVFMEDNGRVAFVQHAQPDIGTDYGYPCSALSEQYLPACYEKLADYRAVQFNENHVAVSERLDLMKNVCTNLEEPQRSNCFFGYGYGLSRLIGNRAADYDFAEQCDSLPLKDASNCMEGLAYYYATFAQINNAIWYCNDREPARMQQCFDVAFAHVGLTLNQISERCTQLNSPSCTSALQSFTKRGLSPVFEEGND